MLSYRSSLAGLEAVKLYEGTRSFVPLESGLPDKDPMAWAVRIKLEAVLRVFYSMHNFFVHQIFVLLREAPVFLLQVAAENGNRSVWAR